jgi:hypothetical protein
MAFTAARTWNSLRSDPENPISLSNLGRRLLADWSPFSGTKKAESNSSMMAKIYLRAPVLFICRN